MPELRWTLLIIGVLFIAILAWWERRRPHQASRQAPHISGDTRPVVNNDPSWGSDVEPAGTRAPHIGREPTLNLPEIRTEARTREPIAARELPIVEIEDAIESDEEISEELEEISDEITQDASVEVTRKVSQRVEREAQAMEAEEEEDEELEDDEEVDASGRGAAFGKADASGTGADTMGRGAAFGKADVTGRGADTTGRGAAFGRADASGTEADTTGRGAALGKADALGKPADAKGADDGKADEVPPPIVKPIVEWPPEDQRKLISLRLVARPPERFRGALVRQALLGEGFVLGAMDIFHKPDAQNRAVLSAASLTKPGTFDLETMDSQRYVGLNLFAVLPGPKSPRKAFEDLLMAARMLNERLEGALQDERGGPLTPMRIQALRDALEVEAKS